MFYDIFCDLCAEKGLSRTKCLTEMGINPAATRRWKFGGVPFDSTLEKMSSYFDVSIEFLKGEEPPAPQEQRADFDGGNLMFYDKFVAICVANGKSPTAVAKEMKLSPSTVANWKQGGEPFLSTLHKIANYFGVPVSALQGEEPPAPQEQRADFDDDSFLQLLFDESKDAIQKAYERGLKECQMTTTECELLHLFRQIPEAEQTKVLSMIRIALGK